MPSSSLTFILTTKEYLLMKWNKRYLRDEGAKKAAEAAPKGKCVKLVDIEYIPHSGDMVKCLDKDGRLVYTRTPYGYEFWYEEGRIVRVRDKEGREWRLNPATDHLEPFTE